MSPASSDSCTACSTRTSRSSSSGSGLALIVIELIVPGHIFSGTIGTILLILAVVSFGLLPVRLIGVGLLVASRGVLRAGGRRHPGLGIWAIAGLIAWSPAAVPLRPLRRRPVSPWVIAARGGLRRALLRRGGPRRARCATCRRSRGAEAIIGKDGVVIGRGPRPRGVVRVAPRNGTPSRPTGTDPGGRAVRVTGLDGSGAHRRTGRRGAPDAAGDAVRAGPGRRNHRMNVSPFLIGLDRGPGDPGVRCCRRRSRSCREYQRLVVFRLGRVLGAKGPGLVLLIPFVDRPPRSTFASSTWRSRTSRRSPRTTRRSRSTSSSSTRSSTPQMSVRAPSGTSPARRRTSPRPPSARWSATCRSTTCWPSASR